MTEELKARELKRQISYLLRASLVKRYHNRTTFMIDTVGRHSCLVALLCWLLAGEACSKALLLAAVAHDLPEAVVGDLTSPIKRILASSQLQALEEQAHERLGLPLFEQGLTAEEQLTLTLADKLEGYLFSMHEVHALGNRSMRSVASKYRSYIYALLSDSPTVSMRLSETAKLLMVAITEATHINPENEEDVCL